MNPITLNFNTRFFKILKFISGKERSFYRCGDWDTCSLTRHCLFVFLLIFPAKLIFVSVLIMLPVGSLGSLGYAIMVEHFKIESAWYLYPVYLLLGVLAFLVALCLISVIAWLIDKVYEYLVKPREQKAPTSPIGVMYASWKDKVCAKVEIK